MSLTISKPLAAVTIIPLISSTCTLWYAFDQHHFLSILTVPCNNKFDYTIAEYFPRFFAAGLPRVLGLLGTTCISVAANCAYRYDSLVATKSLKWYLAGAVLTVSHLVFVPFVMPQIERLHNLKRSPLVGARDTLLEWLYWHNIRTYTVDLAAWVCFAVAVGLNVVT